MDDNDNENENEKKPKGKLPSTAKELSVYRKKPPSKSLLEQADAQMSEVWGKDPKLHAVLTTRVFNGATVEGKPEADRIAGAMYFRQIALDKGRVELGAVPLAKLANMMGAVLRRFDFGPLEIE